MARHRCRLINLIFDGEQIMGSKQPTPAPKDVDKPKPPPPPPRKEYYQRDPLERVVVKK